MKKCIIILCLLALLAPVIYIMPSSQLTVQAKEVIATVYGTVSSGTTSELLKLSTREGNMEIKLDSDTDTSACKILLKDKKIYVSVSHGSDGYLHAVKITSEVQSSTYTVDSTSVYTVTGTIGDKSTDSLVYLNTPQGEMQIKLDPTTNMSGCAVLVAGKQYSVACSRGSDAYMHAITITDIAAAVPAAAGNVVNGNVATMTVSGTVAKSTKEDLLYLATKDGEMQFKIDSNADTTRGMILTYGRKLTVTFYHGSDAYLHAVGIAGEKDSSSSVSIDNAVTMTASGTVNSSSNENILYLDTKYGKMEIKLDKVSSLINCKVLVSGKKINVNLARGSDAYWHAISITGN